MAYEKQTWNTGDVITDAKMNHIEDGIANIELTPGPQGYPGTDGAAGKDAPTITGCTININGTAISGQLTMSEGEPVDITSTYTAGS